MIELEQDKPTFYFETSSDVDKYYLVKVLTPIHKCNMIGMITGDDMESLESAVENFAPIHIASKINGQIILTSNYVIGCTIEEAVEWVRKAFNFERKLMKVRGDRPKARNCDFEEFIYDILNPI